MLSHLASLFNDGYIGIPEEFDKLIIALKSAVINEYTLKGTICISRFNR